MTKESSHVLKTIQVIEKDLELRGGQLKIVGDPDVKQLHNILTIAIREMLDSDFNNLINILYRIDVTESKVTEAMGVKNPADVAAAIAKLVIDRELQKVETRRKYAKGDL